MIRVYSLLCALVAGAQLFFAAGAAQVVFPEAVASLERDNPRRQLAADLVGGMLARLDAATIALTAVAVVLAVMAGRSRAALWPLAAGLCALASMALITPAIQAMRAAGQTQVPRFGMLHGLSSSLLLVEMILLVIAALRG